MAYETPVQGFSSRGALAKPKPPAALPKGKNMKCIYCDGDTQVVNSRPQKRLNRVWRRRTCIDCSTTFTSIESVDLNGSIRVRSKKALEPFQRDKLLLSIHDSLKHRKTALSDATGLTDTVISQLYPLMQQAALEKADIIQVTIKTLQRFDRVAATYYRAYHPL